MYLRPHPEELAKQASRRMATTHGLAAILRDARKGALLRMRSNLLKHNNLMLRSKRRERLEARAASRHDLRDVTALHARTYLARNFLMMGEKNEPRGFLVSPRPVSRCAICRNILAVR